MAATATAHLVGGSPVVHGVAQESEPSLVG